MKRLSKTIRLQKKGHFDDLKGKYVVYSSDLLKG